MAKGDSFVIKVNDSDGNTFLCPGVCNSDFFNDDLQTYNRQKLKSSEKYQNKIDLIEYLNTMFGTDVWQLFKLPLVKANENFDLSLFTQFVPGVYVKENQLPTRIFFNSLQVPNGYFKYVIRDNSCQFSSSDNQESGGSEYFPYCYTRGIIFSSSTNQYLGLKMIVATDDFITNGTIDSSKPCGYVTLDFVYNPEDNVWSCLVTVNDSSIVNGIYNTSFWDGKEVTVPGSGDDPFNPGGNSGEGGGGGSFDNTSKPIEIPNLPPVSASSTGFISLYNPTLEELNNLSSYLWSDLFEIDGWKKLFANPMDAILGLSILPVSIPSGGTKEVKVGNIGTGISLTVASTQFVEVDCGSLDIKEYWGAYLDYEPYTQAQIFLPYIGTRPISVDEIMGKTLSVKYHIDILSGACCCFVKSGDSVLYTFNGQCSIPIPITGADYTSVVNGILTIASSAASMVATGGQTAPLIAAGAAEGATKTAVARGLSASASFTNSMISGSSGIASSLANQMKPQIAKSGSISGSAGLLNMQTPYLIITRPRQALPLDQNKFIGYPSLVTVQLTELTGYTEIQSIHLENIPATSSELDEIENLLKGGVIF